MANLIQLKRPAGRLFDLAMEATCLMRKAGMQTFWVGGAPRDIFLGRTPGDVDMVTTGRPEDIKVLFPDSDMVGACFGVTLVKYKGVVFEVATCRKERSYGDGRHPSEIKFTDDFEADLRRRDFTCNALLYDPESEMLTDCVNGIEDLRNGVLRVVGDARERFAEDYLRMFRAVRFAAVLDLKLDKALSDALGDMHSLTRVLAPERVREELEKMLCSAAPVRALKLLKSSGLLKVWLPEVDALAGVAQHKLYHPEGDVWQHTLLMFEKLEAPADVFLAWSMLLHDIGKKSAFSVGQDGIPHFYCHEAMGGDMVRAIAERLRFSKRLQDAVEHAVRNHMRFAFVREMRQSKLKRLLAEEFFDMELELHRLDCLASNGLMGTWAFLHDLCMHQPQTSLPEGLINGHDLMRMGYKSGPQFKTMLAAAMDAQLEGAFADKAGAEKWVKENFNRVTTQNGSSCRNAEE
ncbi:MAG: CCA tRNA nucleotidyltransferase [Lentisphaerae bacterium]|nr:CCA tRNA nucleotidyltransferase [Lentisphaerota bacterium]